MTLICRFNLRFYEDMTARLVECTEKIFSAFGYEFKKIFTYTADKTRAPYLKEFRSYTNLDYFHSITFQSDAVRSSIESNIRMYADINNRGVRGSEYRKPDGIVRYCLVISDNKVLETPDTAYKTILCALSEIPAPNIIGYSFQLPDSFSPIPFAVGIFPKINMCDGLKNLVKWYDNSDLEKSIVGLHNCFSNVSLKRLSVLKRLFGSDNVEQIGTLTYFKNEAMNSADYSVYFTSDEYNALCSELEAVFPFIKAEYIQIGNELNIRSDDKH